MAASLMRHPLIKFPISAAIFATSSCVWVRTLPLAVAAAKGKDWQKNPTTGYTNYLQMGGLRVVDKMPKHVAVTLDGARRWCEKYNNGRLTYVPFFGKILQLGEFCIKSRIPALSCFVFATCTWRRGQEFANAIFAELESSLKDNIKEFKRKGIRVLVLGDKWRFPNTLQNVVKQVEEETKNGKKLHMIYAVSYGGRMDIVEATKSICMKVMAGDIEPEDVDEALVEQHLSNIIYGVPNPDLMIRNGGKHRLSNFYLWQASHAEFYFCDSLSTDFQEEEFLDALSWFQQRERRFGK